MQVVIILGSKLTKINQILFEQFRFRNLISLSMRDQVNNIKIKQVILKTRNKIVLKTKNI